MSNLWFKKSTQGIIDIFRESMDFMKILFRVARSKNCESKQELKNTLCNEKANVKLRKWKFKIYVWELGN